MLLIPGLWLSHCLTPRISNACQPTSCLLYKVQEDEQSSPAYNNHQRRRFVALPFGVTSNLRDSRPKDSVVKRPFTNMYDSLPLPLRGEQVGANVRKTCGYFQTEGEKTCFYAVRSRFFSISFPIHRLCGCRSGARLYQKTCKTFPAKPCRFFRKAAALFPAGGDAFLGEKRIFVFCYEVPHHSSPPA